MKYNEIIKSLREDKDLTQKELGKIFNVNQITISQYERGTRDLSIEMLLKYSEYFQVSTDYILGKEKKQSYTIKNQFNNTKIKNKNGDINF